MVANMSVLPPNIMVSVPFSARKGMAETGQSLPLPRFHTTFGFSFQCFHTTPLQSTGCDQSVRASFGRISNRARYCR